jgi:hypothetical protein
VAASGVHRNLRNGRAYQREHDEIAEPAVPSGHRPLSEQAQAIYAWMRRQSWLGSENPLFEVRERRIGGVANGRVSADARNEEPDRAIKRGQTYNDPP